MGWGRGGRNANLKPQKIICGKYLLKGSYGTTSLQFPTIAGNTAGNNKEAKATA